MYPAQLGCVWTPTIQVSPDTNAVWNDLYSFGGKREGEHAEKECNGHPLQHFSFCINFTIFCQGCFFGVWLLLVSPAVPFHVLNRILDAQGRQIPFSPLPALHYFPSSKQNDLAALALCSSENKPTNQTTKIAKVGQGCTPLYENIPPIKFLLRTYQNLGAV